MAGRAGRSAAAMLVFGLACLAPGAARLARPSLYADDVPRLAQLQTESITALLFRPFNEHVAPWFELISWLAWNAAGRRLTWAPLAFTLASLVPFPLALGLLHRVLQRETGSATAARLGVLIFGLAPVALETIYWYSASSFLWALVATLAAWASVQSLLGVGRAEADGQDAAGVLPASGPAPRAALGVLVAVVSAPAFSAIGLLAGPVAGLRLLVEPGRRRKVVGGLAVMVGLGLYLGMVLVVRAAWGSTSHGVNAAGMRLGLAAAARAPVAVLMPSLGGIGLRRAVELSPGAASGLTVLLAGLVIGVAVRHRACRPLLLGGLALILGGYALTFIPRAVEMGPGLLKIQRYHLFPMLGLSFVLTGLALAFPPARRGLAWCDARPVAGGWITALLAVALAGWHATERRGLAAFLFDADQHAMLAALDHLHEICEAEGITREQAIGAFDPVGNRWTPPGHNALMLIAPTAVGPRHPDDQVPSIVLARLSAADRHALCGGMDATRYLTRAGGEGPASLDGTPPRRLYRVSRDARGGLVAEGWPSFVEFDLARDGMSPAGAAALALSGTLPAGWVELWWASPGERWSQTRSVRVAMPARTGPAFAWRLPLDRLPHWDRSADRVRLYFHESGPLAASAPRLMR